MTTFGAWLKQERAKRDLTQAESAESIPCSLVMWRKMERDERRPSKQMLARIAATFEADPKWLWQLARGNGAVSSTAADTDPVARSFAKLPLPSTEFVGRENDITKLSAMLTHPDKRLITLVGYGGMGKTRLAIEVAARLQNAMVPVWVPLVGLQPAVGKTQSTLLGAIAAATRLIMLDNVDPIDRIGRQIEGRNVLLVLDNFEHFIHSADATGATALSALLARVPDLTLIVTSRATLNLQEEWLYDLNGLAVPTEVGADFGAWDAIRLFDQRAQRVHAAFSLHENSSAVLGMCRLVEGMPVGIELAAVQVRSHACGEILARLEASAASLETPLHNVPSRQRSFAAVFAHSWSLLPPHLQQTLARISIFRGAFDLEDAVAIAETTEERLDQLVEHSLLRKEADGRFVLHELVREFSAEKLSDSAELEATRTAFATHFMRLLAASEPTMRVGDNKTRIRLSRNHPHFVHAWRIATEQNLLREIARGGTALAYYFDMQSHWHEGYLLFCETMEHLESSRLSIVNRMLRVPIKAGLQLGAGNFAMRLGRFQAAEQFLEAATPRLRQLRQHDTLFIALINRGTVMLSRADLDNALACYHEAHAIAKSRKKPAMLAYIEGFLAKIEWDMHGSPHGRELLERSFANYQHVGDKRGMAGTTHYRSLHLIDAGDLAGAEEALQTALSLAREAEAHSDIANILMELGKLCTVRDDLEAATAWHRLALQTAEQFLGATTLSLLSVAYADLCLRQKWLEEAISHADRAIALSEAASYARGKSAAYLIRAAIEVETGATETAVALVQKGIAIAEQLHMRRTILSGKLILARALRCSDPAHAAKLLSQVCADPATHYLTRHDAQQLFASSRSTV